MSQGLMVTHVKFHTSVETLCPHGGKDVNEVLVEYSPKVPHSTWGPLPAEEVAAQIDAFKGREIFCEDLAAAIADDLWNLLICHAQRGYRVTVTQVQGHGVAAVAEVAGGLSLWQSQG